MSPRATDFWTRIGPWIAAIIFGAGGMAVSHQLLAARMADVEARQDRGAESLTQVRLNSAKLAAIEEDKRMLAADLKQIMLDQQKLVRRIDSLCAALGKRCTPEQ